MIVGSYDAVLGARIKGSLYLPSLDQFAHLTFVVDPGASHTSISNKDLDELRVDLGMLPLMQTRDGVLGVGGLISRFVMEGGIAFEHTNGQPAMVRLPISVLPDAPVGVPSLLGRDILMLGRVVLDPETETVSFDLPPRMHDLLS